MRYLIAVLISVLTISCQSKIGNGNIKETNIDFNSLDTLNLENWHGKVITKDKRLSKIMDTVILIPLETNPECLISNIRKVRITKNRIFIFDDRQEMVFVFTEEGKFLAKLDEKGKGPHEYFQLNDFTINDKNEIVVISFGRQIIAYDFKGNYLWKRNINIMAANDIEYISNDIYYINCMYRDERAIGEELQYNLLRFHKDSGIIAKYFPYKNNFGREHQFTKNEYFGVGLNDTLFFTKFYDNNIYKLWNDSVNALKNINISGMDIEKEKVFNIVDLSVEFNKKEIFTYLCNYHTTTDYAYLSYRISNSKINIYINKENGDKYFTSNPEWLKESNFYYYILGYHSPIYSVDNYFVTTIYPFDWFETMKIMTHSYEKDTNKSYLFPNKWIIETLSKLDKSSNPVLVKYKLRSNTKLL